MVVTHLFDTKQLYDAAQGLWVLLSIGAIVVVYTGNAEPYLAATQLPGSSSSPELALAGVGVVLLLVGVLPIQLRKRRVWKRMGRGIGLAPTGGGLLGKPDLTGEVRGRPVRVHTTKRKTSKGDQGTTSVTVTVIEADLSEPTDVGLMIGRKPAGERAGKTDLGSAAVQNVAVGDRFTVTGTDVEDLAKSTLTAEARDALLNVESLETVTVGDPTGTVMNAMPDMSGSFLGNMAENRLDEKLRERFAGDASTVAHEQRGVLLDADGLEQQVTAAVAVAESFENATAGHDGA